MRHKVLFALAALAAAACASSPSSNTGSTTAATPAASSSASTSTTASAGGNVCAAGDCQIIVDVPSDLTDYFNRQQANYKLYQGCPRTFGVSSPDGLRGVTPLATSRTTTINVPANFSGRYATLALFNGATPVRYVLVDLSAKKSSTVNFGYRWTGNTAENDNTIINTNTSFLTRSCR